MVEESLGGKSLRVAVPRAAHAAWEPHPARDPLAILRGVFATLIPDLRAIRGQRMARSPFAFYRGSAAVMAADLAATPRTGRLVQISGDAHVANFGGYAAPERRLVFDVNDFDETARGPWEWDVKRLAASLILAGRAAGLRVAANDDVVRAALSTYRVRTREYAEMAPRDVWYATIDIRGSVRAALDSRAKRPAERPERDGRSRTALNLLSKVTELADGQLRFVEDPPLLEHTDGTPLEKAQQVLDAYRTTLRPEARLLIDRYKLVDAARKVVGVGSVGTWCVLLLMTDDRNDELLLQAKEARASVLEPYVGPQPYSSHGERVVTGQRMMQAASDVLLGWAELDGTCFYVRQYRNNKTAPDVTTLGASELSDYAAHCAWTLARAHARTADARPVADYLGRGDAFDEAVALWARAYADQTERDHAAFVAALPTGGFLTA
ncbi:MAG TPA: DUF2252 domain-containing protein [Candidatus Sulfotelmatobacter sp.]|nr:DUF2252 domain-containing protein [Candidatus Sulfotelmatobacter sp.]